MLDLDGDGIETISVANGAWFDHAVDGFAELTAWAGTDDGLLVHDLDGNGSIDSGRELFGSETLLPNGAKAANGFEALKALDANTDGVIDAQDVAFAELRIWKDTNANGRTDAGELLTLAEAGVSSINVAYANSSHTDAQGNAHRQVGSYTTTSGETRTATDIWVQTNPTQSLPTDWVIVPEDIAALPDAQGYGLVRDLHQAMAMDASGELKGLVEAFTQATTPQDRDLLVTRLIYHWTGVQDVDPFSRASRSSYGNVIGDARKLEALEAFMGEEWVGVWCWGTRDPNPHGRAAPVLLQAWDELKALVYGQLMAQTHLQGLFQQITYQWDEEVEAVVGDLTGVAHALAQRIEAERETGLDALGDFLYSLKGMGLLGSLNVEAFRMQLGALGSDVESTMGTALQGWAGDNTPTEGADVLRGTDFDNVIDGRGGNDRLVARGGNDLLIGGFGNDVLDGGTGNDEMRGGEGADTYIYRRGDGHDTIVDDTRIAGETDRIELKAGLSADDVRLQRVRTGSGWPVQDDLRLIVRDTGETITVKNHFGDGERHAIEEIVFADGTVWDAEAIRSQVLLGGAEDEELRGYVGRDDVIDGGAGNDLLRGGDGSDTYRYGRGDGHDTISEDTWTPGETDRIELKAGLSADDVRLQRVRNVSVWLTTDDLVLTIRDTGETLTVKGHFIEGQRHAVEEVVFADGTVWDAEAIRSRVLLGEAAAEVLRGFADRDDVIQGGAGNDHLQGLSGNDTLDGGADNDVLEGGRGSDTYHYQLGEGVDVINEHHEPDATDALTLGEGISPGDVTLRWNQRGDLQVHLPDGGLVTVTGQASGNGWTAGTGIEFIRFSDGTEWDIDEMYRRTAFATDGDDDLVLGDRDDVVDGGAGNDQLHNLGGNDTFLFGVGDGHDLIRPTGGALRFKEGLVQDDVRFTTEGTDLVATLKSSGDTVRLKNWHTTWSRIDRFEFHNGTVLGVDEVRTLLNADEQEQVLFGSPGDDVLTTSGEISRVYAGDGNDVLMGQASQNELNGEEGDDVLLGGDGSDHLSGGEGDDTLDGGAGRDGLAGGTGHNTYRMTRGMGLDTVIAELHANAWDTVELAEGITLADVTVGLEAAEYSGDPQPGDTGFQRMVVGIGGNDALLIERFDPLTYYKTDLGRLSVQRFVFADGTELSLSDIMALADPGELGLQLIDQDSPAHLWGSAGDDDIVDETGNAVARRVDAGDNNDQVAVNWTNNHVAGGAGSDQLFSGSGDDIVAGGAGDDRIDTEGEDDVVVFNRGDGHDHVTFGEGIDTLSLGSIDPASISFVLGQYGDLVVLVDGGESGSITISDFEYFSEKPSFVERLQFIDAAGSARVFDFSGWLDQHGPHLLAATAAAPLPFNGTGFEMTGWIAPAGGLEAVAYAQTGDLFVNATLVNNHASDLSDVLYGTAAAESIDAGLGNDIVIGLEGHDVLHGQSGNDVLDGGEGDDVLHGGEGDDALLGSWGADVLHGGAGRDLLKGGAAGDTYHFARGDGHDTIQDGHNALMQLSGYWERPRRSPRLPDEAPNVLVFGEGLSQQDLRLREQDGDLVIEFTSSPGDRLTLKDFDPSRATQTRSIDVFRFADGTELMASEITVEGFTIQGSDDGAWLEGTPFADQLIGGDGDDVLEGQGGADRLAGRMGSDTYYVRASTTPEKPAQTVIAEVWRPQDVNVLVIDGEVSRADLWLALEGDDLVLRIGQGGDSVRFAGFDPRVPGMPAPVERIELADTGEVIRFNDLLAQGVYDPDAPLPDLQVNVGDGAVDVDAASAANSSGTLAFGEGIDAQDIQGNLRSEADGNGGHWLVIHYGDAGDVLRLAGFNPSDVLGGDHAVDRFSFADGTAWDYATLVSEGFVVAGDEQANDLTGTNLADQLHGGSDSDVLRGGEGDDSYVFNIGDGVDTIVDSGATDFNFIRFGAGIRPQDIREEWDGSTLVVHYSEGDAVRIADYHGSEGNPVVLALVFDDGSVLSLTERMNRAPEVAADLQDAAVTQDEDFQMFLPADLFHDPDAMDELRLSIRLANGDALPSWLAFDPALGLLHGRPSGGDVGTLSLLVEARDHFGATASQTFALDVLPGNENLPPTVNPDTATLPADATAPVSGNVLHNDTDPDGDALSLLSSGAQQGIFGVLTWHADGAFAYALNNTSPELKALGAGQSATEHFAYTATDSHAQAQGELVITVNGVNDAPVVQQTLSNMLVIKKETATWQLPADAFVDPDQGDSLSYSAALADGGSLPAWMVFDAATRSFVAAPPATAAANLAVQVTATDAHGASASQVFQVRVGNAGDQPKGNEGLGNGEDPPPPGHDTNQNDGAQTGSLRSSDEPTTTQTTTDATGPAPSPALVDWSDWNARQGTSATQTESTPANPAIERHWQQLLATLQRLDAERNAGDLWSDPAWGAGHGLAGLSAGGLQAGASGSSAVGLGVGSGTHLVGFNGLKEGVASLAA
ncbi:calcium-binding protein [Hydrogenophaga sp.]|uniref:calcium-binding protein n=1 Tax=Hydrogenophaga sp. TaxID=1904254 RepID=UPI0025C1FC7F|nr:calcium-binding protein [Hydrogenophaga sp.]MBT9464373.1 VCBS domain-containing protein [Hydrogenophaga sp.]